MALPKPTRQRRNWDQGELENYHPPRPTQPAKSAGFGPSIPVWLFVVGGIVIVKVIILILQYVARA